LVSQTEGLSSRAIVTVMLLPAEQLGAIEDLELDVRWDAATLHAEVMRRAAALSGLDIGRGSLVAILHGNSARFLADLLAVWQVGAAAACLDAALTERERETLVRFMHPGALLVDGAAAAGGFSALSIDLTAADRVTEGKVGDGFGFDDPALVLFTSGTTGNPKGVVLTFRALLTRVRLNIAAIGKAALARALVTLPTHFGHGLIGNTLTPLLAGGTIVLPLRGRTLAHDLGRIVDDHGVTFMSSVPALWPLVLRTSARPQRGTLNRVHVGSAPLSTRLWGDIVSWSRAEVVNCYGMTETANWFAGASSRADAIAHGLVGKPWGGNAAVIDERGCIRSTGEGEIVLQSPTLMLGYLHRADLTAAAYRHGWYRTGDRGAVNERQEIRLHGRIKDEINRAGFKVQPSEIDQLLETHPAVAEACVFGIADNASGEAVAAAVRLMQGASANAESLRSWCRERLRREAVPERWYIVDEMPRTARGKVSRELVRRTLVQDGPDDAAI
jgi:acyl-CoA synthetase (AMP-forming)/AMP-acid ligase II